MTTKKDYLHFHKPLIGQEEIDEVTETLKSGWLTTGPRTKKFEKVFQNYIGVKNAIALNSCTAGLHLALVAAGISRDDEVITTPITFPATMNVILHQQAKPVFADISLDTLNINPEKIEKLITPKTKAIIPVHFAGHPCEMDTILKIAKKHNLTVVEDAAHALESEYKGKKIGTLGDFASFSFYATKNITTGEGGMLTTNRDDLVDKIRIMSLHGISKDAWKRYGKDGFVHWEHHYPGFKYNMFDIQAAIGLHQIQKTDQFWKKRKCYTEMYQETFSSIPEVITLDTKPDIKHAYHLYVIMIKTENLSLTRDDILKQLQDKNIGAGVHFRALHTQPLYKKLTNHQHLCLPNAEYASERIISLPLYPKMTKEDVLYVIESVKKILS